MGRYQRSPKNLGEKERRKCRGVNNPVVVDFVLNPIIPMNGAGLCSAMCAIYPGVEVCTSPTHTGQCFDQLGIQKHSA